MAEPKKPVVSSAPSASDPGLLVYIFRHLWDIFEDGALRAAAVVIIFLWLCGSFDDFMAIIRNLSHVFSSG